MTLSPRVVETIKKSIQDEMVEGYYAGLDDTRDELPAQSNHSPAYQHGWNNGRDDRFRKPRASARMLREVARGIAQDEQDKDVP